LTSTHCARLLAYALPVPRCPWCAALAQHYFFSARKGIRYLTALILILILPSIFWGGPSCPLLGSVTGNASADLRDRRKQGVPGQELVYCSKCTGRPSIWLRSLIQSNLSSLLIVGVIYDAIYNAR
jgi:hypothetical protein